MNRCDIYNLKVALALRQMIKEDSLAANQISLISSAHHHFTCSARNNNCIVPLVRTNIGKSAIKFQGPLVWNSIPLTLKDLPLPLFKKKLRSHYLDNYSILEK